MHTEPATADSALGREGFALALVVLLLFAIALTGATGYRVVASEAFQSQQALETDQSLAVAQGGLEWFVGNQRGTIPGTTNYDVNGGTAVITTRKIATLSLEEDLYLVQSEGIYTDPRFPSIPATRIVSQYAVYKKVPLNVMAPVMTTAYQTTVGWNGQVDGDDDARWNECSSSRVAVTLPGVISQEDVSPKKFATVVDLVNTAWDVYSDPTFPVDDDGDWPVRRVIGDYSAGYDESGQGVLIVTGTLTIEDAFRRNNKGSRRAWTWDGIILAGDIADIGPGTEATILGVLVGGMGTPMGDDFYINGSTIQYQSCYVESAGLSLAHLSPMDNSWWEGG